MSSKVVVCSALLFLAMTPTVSAQGSVDYSVFFFPSPGAEPEKSMAGGGLLETQNAIVYNAAQNAGTHSYKLLLRAFAPDASVACETTVAVEPWSAGQTMKKVAAFEAFYPSESPGAARPKQAKAGKYLLRAYLMEQIPPGGQREDTTVANNQYPYEPPQYLPVEFEVRQGARDVRCVALPRAPSVRIPANLKLPK